MALLGSATYELDADQSRFNRSLAKAERTSRESAKRIGKNFAKIGAGMLVAGAGIGLALFKLGGQASDLNESINAVNVVFGQGKKTILDFSRTASTVVGLAASDFNQLSATTGALFKNFGLSEQEAAEETINLTKRAGDLASVFNTDVGDALGALQAAVRGETEPLRRFAGDVTDASLELFLLEKGITRSVSEMTQAEKGLLRYEVAMAQTAVVEGDFRNTATSAANATRILKAQIKDAAASMGQGLLPVFEAVLPLVQDVVASFQKWATANPKLMRTFVLVTAAVAALAVAMGGLLLVAAGAMMAFGALGVAGLITVGWIGLSILAVIALVAAGVWLVKNWDKVKTSLVSVFDTVLAWVQPVVDAFALWAENNPKLMRALVIARQAVDGLAMALSWLKQQAEDAWEAIKTFAEEQWGKIKEIWEEGGLELALLGAAAALAASMTAMLAVWTAKMLSHLAVWTATSLARMAAWSAAMLVRFAVFTVTSLARMALWPAKMLVHLAVWTVTSLAQQIAWRAKMLAVYAVWMATSLARMTVWVAGMLARFALWTITSLGEMAVWVGKMLIELAVWTASSLASMAVWVAGMLSRFAVWTATSLARMAVWTARMLALMTAWAARMAAMWLVAIGPVGWIILGVTALGAAAALMMANWESIDARWRKLWDGLKDSAVGVLNAIIEKINQVIALWNKIPAVPSIGDIGKVGPDSIGTPSLEAVINASTLGTPFHLLRLGTLLKKGAGLLGGTGGDEEDGEIPGLARGGIVTGPTLARIGEAGPEAVVPLGKLGKGGLGGGLTIIFQGDVYGGEDFGDRVRDAVDESTRRGVVFGAV